MKIKKYAVVLLLIIFVIPSVALASWWNPTTWKIFSFLHKKDVNLQSQVITQKVYEDKIAELQKQIEDLKGNKTADDKSVADAALKEQIRAQVEKEVKSKIDQAVLSTKDKTLSEQVGVTKEKLTACMQATDQNALSQKIQTSVENAMKALPAEQRGTPYSIVIGNNGVKTEIFGALPIEEVRKTINAVKSGSVESGYKGDVAMTEVGDNTTGNANATVKIIEYSDLECPFCKIYHDTLKKIVAESGGTVSWTYRHWPIHQNSFEKLVAAECVAKLKGNDAFWKYVDLLFGMIDTGEQQSVTDQL